MPRRWSSTTRSGWRRRAPSTTTVGGIELDGELLEPPYVIDVIGEPHALHSAMTFGSGPIEQLQLDGATVEVDRARRRSTSRACALPSDP